MPTGRTKHGVAFCAALLSLPGPGEAVGSIVLCIMACAQTWHANRCVMHEAHPNGEHSILCYINFLRLNPLKGLPCGNRQIKNRNRSKSSSKWFPKYLICASWNLFHYIATGYLYLSGYLLRTEHLSFPLTASSQKTPAWVLNLKIGMYTTVIIQACEQLAF